MAVANADVLERSVAAVVSQHERSDASRVRLKREHEHVAHQADLFAIAQRFTRRRRDTGVGQVTEIFESLQTPLDFANTVQVLVEFVSVRGAELAR